MRALSFIVAIVAGIAVLAVTLSREDGQAAFPGVNGQIAFYDVAGESRHIFVRTPGTGSRTQLTFGDDFDQNPEYSADGQKIVFDRVRNDVRSVWIMNADGSNQQEVPNTETGRAAAWSPDSEWIVFTLSELLDIYKVRPDGSDLTQLTDDPETNEIGADWSPDGSKIAFRLQEEIWIMNPDGTDQEQLTDGSLLEAGGPDWSPNGSKIVFEADSEVRVMNADGSELTSLTDDQEGDQGSPQFSPDGQEIVYVDYHGASRGRYGPAGSLPSELYTMNAGGSGKTNLTQDGLLIEDSPTWGSFGTTPGPTEPPGQNVVWGDNRCDGKLDATDGLAVLRHVAALSELSQTQPCPTIEQAITVLQPGLWGDVDCDQDVDTVDDLKVLRVIAGFQVEQPKNCYPIGLADAVIHY